MIGYLCREWSEIFRKDSGAKYWSWTRLWVDLGRLPDQAQDLLGFRIIRLVPEIYIFRAHQNLIKMFLEFVKKGVTLQLKKLKISNTDPDDIDGIDPGLLTTVTLKLQDCTIYGADVAQQEAILSGIRDSTSTSLRHLDMGNEVLQVAPDILVGAAMKLERMTVSLSTLQLEAIITMLAATEDFRLRQLILHHNIQPVKSLDPEVVAGALTKLEAVDQNLCLSLSADQFTALISRICQAPVLRLTKLWIDSDFISLVPPEVLVGAIQRLEMVVFWWGRMTDEQFTAILTKAKENELGKIKNIYISSILGMWSVSPSLLEEAKQNKKLTIC